MDKRRSTNSSSSRAPLGEIPQRANSASSGTRAQHLRTNEAEFKENIPVVFEDGKGVRKSNRSNEHDAQSPINHRLSPIISQASQEQNASKRASQISTTSASTTNSDSKLKSHIGPWQLGKTLGKGSSARVRLARHRVTHQSVAVKIISKRTAYLSQAGSIAQLDRMEKYQPEEKDGVRRLPVTVEREIAIMKLIEHPNVIKILDVWENRNEIYIILEYCDSKDMFSWINKYGPLSEHDTVYVFRQMMCAMEYCHSFNICHRDLKPENILLSETGEVKIIDFGMAALHQNDQKLRTSCGSPHYAAPELLKSRTYRGDKADVWSMGVILFAMLAQRLPFDDPHLPTMLSMSKRAIFEMPAHFSPEAQDMVRRILVTDPDKRISISEMWEHPLVTKYDKRPGFEKHRKQPIDMKARAEDAQIKSRDIDPQILRQLRAMSHASDVKDIKGKLTSKGPNEQKVFYHLLVSHRDRLLEDYDPKLTHSASDYHHLRPHAWATRVSTRQFNNIGRSPSRFTVISTVADTEVGGTVRSYDPYNASCNLTAQQASRAKITIHPGRMDAEATKNAAPGAVVSGMAIVTSQINRRLNSSLRSRTVSYAQSQRSSMGSIHSTRKGTSGVLVKRLHRRGVDFSSVRKAAVGPRRWSLGQQKAAASANNSGDRKGNASQHDIHEKNKAENSHLTGSMGDMQTGEDEEIIRFSNSIAEACDDAFRSSLIGSPADSVHGNIRSSITPLTIEFDSGSVQRTPERSYNPRASNPWDSRPLPPTPPIELITSPLRRNKVKLEEIPSPYGRYGPNVSLHVAPLSTPSSNQRRVTSAPVYAQYARESRHLPSIFENSTGPLNVQSRVVSAPSTASPVPLPTPNDNKGLEFLARTENTIRIVESPMARKSTGSAVIPQPLKVLKKTPPTNTDYPQGRKVTQEMNYPRNKPAFHSQLPDLAEEPTLNGRSSSNGSSVEPKKKISTWFRRTSKNSSKDDVTETPDTSVVSEDQFLELVRGGAPQRFTSTSTALPPDEVIQSTKKKGLMFWKTPKNDQRMSIAAPDYEDDSHSSDPEHTLLRAGSISRDHGEKNESSARKIEPQQNWLARLFRVKAATRYLCLQISRRRARQEVTILLREWRKWGMRDIEVDKERNIVFARVGKKNFLKIKEVHFAVEIITVIEHGKRNHLSIVRFTQERGAASSFHKVVDTVNGVFSSRGLLVQDGRKAKMMIRTLNS